MQKISLVELSNMFNTTILAPDVCWERKNQMPRSTHTVTTQRRTVHADRGHMCDTNEQQEALVLCYRNSK